MAIRGRRQGIDGTAPVADDARLRRDLRSSTADAVSFSLMVGAGETYLPAFALALGASDLAAGLIGSLPIAVGAFFQLLSPTGVAWMGSHRRWVTTCAAFQALSLIPFVVGAVRGEMSLAAILVTTSAYWAFGMATGPSWNTWIESLVPKSVRARFFAQRSHRAQLALLVGMTAAGLLLREGEQRQQSLWVFAGLFAFAALARAVSTWFLSRQSEPEPIPPGYRGLGVAEILRPATERTDHHLLAYLLCFQASVYVAAPFFTPLMLGPLALGYAEYMVLIALSFVARVLALPVLGRIASRVPPARLLWIGGVGIAPLAVAWNVSDSLLYLALLQLFAGVVWATHELAVLLLFFDSIHRSERTSVLTLFNFANALAMLVGTAVGAALLAWLGTGGFGYAVVLSVSSAARLLSLPLMRRIRRPGPQVIVPAMRPLAARPSLGNIDRPVLASLDAPEPLAGGPPAERPRAAGRES